MIMQLVCMLFYRIGRKISLLIGDVCYFRDHSTGTGPEQCCKRVIETT